MPARPRMVPRTPAPATRARVTSLCNTCRPVRATPPSTRSVTRDCRARERGHRLRFDSAPLDTGPEATDPYGASCSDGAPAPVLRRHGSRVPRAGGPRARPPLRPALAAGAGSGGAGEVPFVAHLRHAAEHEATKPIACLLSACRRKTCGTHAGPNNAAGRRGRRRSAYEAPRAAADGGTRLGGAESETAPLPPRTAVSAHAPS